MAPATLQPYPDDRPGVVGDLRVLPGIEARQLDRAVDLLVWLPPGYAGSGARYPVVYLHDGQNLFDPAASHAGVEWQVDETMTALHAEGLDAVVVGIPNAGDGRAREYTPYPHPEHGGGDADRYVAFLADTVKPLIDATVRTVAEPARTVVAGSSLGGVVSLHAYRSRPDAFGRAGVFSPAFWWPGEPMLADLEAGLPAGRVYLDVGGKEDPDHPELQRAYAEDARRVAALLERHGIEHRFVYDPEAIHHESAWAQRLPEALRFLLGR